MGEGDRQGEVHRADPVYRRQMQAVLVATLVVGIAGVVALQWWLRRLGAHAGVGDLYTYELWLHRLLAGVCLVLAAAAVAFAQWLYRTARATAQERRWPESPFWRRRRDDAAPSRAEISASPLPAAASL